MQRILRSLNWGLVLVFALGGVVMWLGMEAGAQQRTRRRTSNRAKIFTSLRNNGTNGHTMDGGDIFGPEMGMGYPGQWQSTYFAGIVNRNRRNDLSRGNGIWVMAKSEDGDVFVSRGGPRQISPDIVAIQRHPRNNPEGLLPIWRSIRRQGAHPFNMPNYGQNTNNYWPRAKNLKIKSHFVNGEPAEWKYGGGAAPRGGGLGNRGFPPGPDKVEPMDYFNWGYGMYPMNQKQLEDTIKKSHKNLRRGLNQMRSNGMKPKDIRAHELWGENVLMTKWANASGVTTTRIHHAYATPGTTDGQPIPVAGHKNQNIWTDGDYDDFLIQEIEIENNGDIDGDGKADAGFPKMMDEVYIVMKNGFLNGRMGAQWVPAGGANSNAWDLVRTSTHDDYWRYTQAPNYDRPEFATNYKGSPMHFTYIYDGDAVARLWNDYGEPYFRSRAQHQFVSTSNIKEGTLLASQFIGMLPLATGTSDHPFNEDDAAQGYVLPEGPQPHGIYRWKMFSSGTGDDPHGGTHSDSDLFNIYGHPDSQFPHDHNNDDLGAWVDAHVYGPYKLAPGEKAKVVFAYVAGMGANSARYRNDGLTYARPFEWEWTEWSRIEEIELGHEAVYHHANEAQKLYDLGFDGINQPPDIKYNLFTNRDGHMEINWSGIDDTAIDPDLERPDVLGYRVYRSDFMRVGPWKLLTTIPKAEGPSGEKQLPAGAPNNSDYESKYSNEAWVELNDPGPAPEDEEFYKWGTYAFVDKTLEPGFKHLYSIRAYDEQGLEIGNSDMRRQNSWPVTGVSLKVVSFAEADRMATPIRVVPNPWVQGDNNHSYGAARIRFINVPSRAKLFIYTITGDLVWRQTFDSLDPTVGQPNPTAEFEWDTATVNLNINTTGRLNAGTYIWAIESLHPDSFGQVQKGIFLIVN